jgi:hypothetical protein
MMWGIERRAGTTALLVHANQAAGSPVGTAELHGMVGNLKAGGSPSLLAVHAVQCAPRLPFALRSVSGPSAYIARLRFKSLPASKHELMNGRVSQPFAVTVT